MLESLSTIASKSSIFKQMLAQIQNKKNNMGLLPRHVRMRLSECLQENSLKARFSPSQRTLCFIIRCFPNPPNYFRKKSLLFLNINLIQVFIIFCLIRIWSFYFSLWLFNWCSTTQLKRFKIPTRIAKLLEILFPLNSR